MYSYILYISYLQDNKAGNKVFFFLLLLLFP